MQSHRWIFYTDLFGGQRWEKLDAAGLTIAESQEGFPTLADAMADASLQGYRPGDDYADCAFEWHCQAVASLACHDDVAAEDLVLIQH